ncbi:MAG: hypothetical protein AB1420_11005 [Bacillota bacterium]
MDCQEIRIKIHELLDNPQGVEEMERRRVLTHSHSCPDCAALWKDLQRIEMGFLEMEVLEPPCDYSQIDWDELAKAELGSDPFAFDYTAPKFSTWFLMSLGSLVILALSLWAVITVPHWWGLIRDVAALEFPGWLEFTQILTQMMLYVKEISMGIVLISSFWQGALYFVLNNFAAVTGAALASLSILVYLLKNKNPVAA